MKAEEISCGYCRGLGHGPFGNLFEGATCAVCGGRGRVWVAVPHLRCAHCGGTGAVKHLTCTVCGGKGAVPAWPDADTVCPECDGSGDDRSASAMSCLTCRGSGRIANPKAAAEPISAGEPSKPN